MSVRHDAWRDVLAVAMLPEGRVRKEKMRCHSRDMRRQHPWATLGKWLKL